MEESKVYKCQKCNYKTLRKGDYYDHCNSKKHLYGSSKKQPNGYNCDKCNYKSDNKHNYNTHYLNNHSTVELRKEKFTYYCSACDFGTFASGTFELHRKTKSHEIRIL